MKWVFISLLILASHFSASYLVPLDDKAKKEFAGLIAYAWPWAYGNDGLLGKITITSGFPISGFYIAVTSATLFFLAALAFWGVWVPTEWWKMLTIAGSILSILLMILFFDSTKIIPILLDVFLLWIIFSKSPLAATN